MPTKLFTTKLVVLISAAVIMTVAIAVLVFGGVGERINATQTGEGAEQLTTGDLNPGVTETEFDAGVSINEPDPISAEVFDYGDVIVTQYEYGGNPAPYGGEGEDYEAFRRAQLGLGPEDPLPSGYSYTAPAYDPVYSRETYNYELTPEQQAIFDEYSALFESGALSAEDFNLTPEQQAQVDEFSSSHQPSPSPLALSREEILELAYTGELDDFFLDNYLGDEQELTPEQKAFFANMATNPSQFASAEDLRAVSNDIYEMFYAPKPLPFSIGGPSCGTAASGNFSSAEEMFDTLKKSETYVCVGKKQVHGCQPSSVSSSDGTSFHVQEAPGFGCSYAIETNINDTVVVCPFRISDSLLEQLEELGIKRGDAVEELADKVAELSSTESALSAARADLKAAQDSLEAAEGAEEIAALQTEVNDLEAIVLALELRVEEINKEIEEIDELTDETYALIALTADSGTDCGYYSLPAED
tara:strand:+ start:44051 stop:45469 length:1419 start_codon:yes stop_codon:yes gene_type:complete